VLTCELDSTNQIVHSTGETLLVKEEGESVNAVDDFREILAIVQVDRFESEDLHTSESVSDDSQIVRSVAALKTYIGKLDLVQELEEDRNILSLTEMSNRILFEGSRS
jgi:hypothetical protein